MTRIIAICLISSALGACAGANEGIPSLQPRAAERIDPRIPVAGAVNDRPADPALVARLAALVARARGGEAAFGSAIASAQAAASAAGPPQSESWIVAQEALSAAVEARGPAAIALGEIDSIQAEMLAGQGGLAPSDKQAIEEAAATVAAIARQQAEAISTVQSRLGA